MSSADETGEMRKRRTAMADGRYLIYYTFGDAGPEPAEPGAAAEAEPEAGPPAEEERRV